MPVGSGVFAVVTALLRSPGTLAASLSSRPDLFTKLAVITFATFAITGLVMGGFSGGMQLLWVPLKVGLGMMFAALICLPSLYVFASVAGSERTLRETGGALLMGSALTGILMVGFAPVTWLFSQATTSAHGMGSLQLMFFLIAHGLGLGLVRRTLSNGVKVSGSILLWGMVYLLVVLQVSTMLRPLLGPDDGMLWHSKTFFLQHWFGG